MSPLRFATRWIRFLPLRWLRARLDRPLEELLDGRTVAGKARQAATDGQDAFALGAEQVQIGVPRAC